MLALLALVALLLLLARLLPRMATTPVLLVWVLLWLPLLWLLFWRRRMARRAWVMVHLKEESPWSARLRGGVLMLLTQAVAAALLALALLASLARGIPASVWIVLVLTVPLWVKAWTLSGRYLRRHASGQFLPLTSARVLVWGFAAVLLAGLAFRGLWQPVPDLGGLTLYEAVRQFAAARQVQSPPLEGLLSVIGALDGARHWLAQHWLDGLSGLALRFVAWMVVLVREWLFVWPWLLLCEALSQLVYRHEPDHEPLPAGH